MCNQKPWIRTILWSTKHYIERSSNTNPTKIRGVKSFAPESCEFEPRSWRGVLDTTLCDKFCQKLATGRLFSLDSRVYFTNKTDRHDITEILLKVALNTINQPTNQPNGINSMNFHFMYLLIFRTELDFFFVFVFFLLFLFLHCFHYSVTLTTCSMILFLCRFHCHEMIFVKYFFVQEKFFWYQRGYQTTDNTMATRN